MKTAIIDYRNFQKLKDRPFLSIEFHDMKELNQFINIIFNEVTKIKSKNEFLTEENAFTISLYKKLKA